MPYSPGMRLRLHKRLPLIRANRQFFCSEHDRTARHATRRGAQFGLAVTQALVTPQRGARRRAAKKRTTAAALRAQHGAGRQRAPVFKDVLARRFQQRAPRWHTTGALTVSNRPASATCSRSRQCHVDRFNAQRRQPLLARKGVAALLGRRHRARRFRSARRRAGEVAPSVWRPWRPWQP